MQTLITFKNTILTELTKQKKTLAFWGAIIAPLFVISVNFLIFFSRPKLLQAPDSVPWIKVAGNSINIFSILMLPLLVTLVAFLVNNVEHKANGWKHLFALPVNRTNFYTGKLIVAAGLILFSLFVFDALILLSIKLLSAAHPEINFSKDASFNLLVVTSFKMFVASLLVLTIQFVISINSKNFLVSIGIGVAGTIGTAMLLSWEHSNWIPYALPMLASQGFYKMNFSFVNQVIGYSFTGSIIVFAGGYFTIRNKNIN